MVFRLRRDRIVSAGKAKTGIATKQKRRKFCRQDKGEPLRTAAGRIAYHNPQTAEPLKTRFYFRPPPHFRILHSPNKSPPAAPNPFARRKFFANRSPQAETQPHAGSTASDRNDEYPEESDPVFETRKAVSSHSLGLFPRRADFPHPAQFQTNRRLNRFFPAARHSDSVRKPHSSPQNKSKTGKSSAPLSL